MRKIEAEIDLAGKLCLEFIGFAGEDCEEERERLRRVLVESGVALKLEQIKRKSSSQILEEKRENSEGRIKPGQRE